MKHDLEGISESVRVLRDGLVLHDQPVGELLVIDGARVIRVTIVRVQIIPECCD